MDTAINEMDMPLGDDAVDDLKRDILTEMADNFFTRRRALEARLEAFVAIRAAVIRRGLLALARWRAFRELLGPSPATDAFLTELGFDVPELAAIASLPVACFPPGRHFAWTPAGRFGKAVRDSYTRLHDELAAYNTDCYLPDTRDPRRMQHQCGYQALLVEAQTLNQAIEAVNASQAPSDLVRFTKELDPVRQEHEAVCGALAQCSSSLDQALAYRPLDMDDLGAPKLPTPPPLDDIETRLVALARKRYQDDPERAKAALRAQYRAP